MKLRSLAYVHGLSGFTGKTELLAINFAALLIHFLSLDKRDILKCDGCI